MNWHVAVISGGAAASNWIGGQIELRRFGSFLVDKDTTDMHDVPTKVKPEDRGLANTSKVVH